MSSQQQRPIDGQYGESDNEQEAHGELGPPKEDFSAPPPYEFTNSSGQPQRQLQLLHNQSVELIAPPPHVQPQIQSLSQHTLQQEIPLHHGKLPTYEEVQMEKSLNGELPPAFMTAPHNPLPPPNPLMAGLRDGGGGAHCVGGSGTQSALTFIAINTTDADNLTNSDNSLLGTDIMFIMAFMVAFLFNWIGFLMLTCFCHTIAARFGALSGFGLSLAKWTLIVKNSTDLASHENSWLWWLIMAFGFLICVRALIQYVSIKRTWRLLSTSAQERLLFFY